MICSGSRLIFLPYISNRCSWHRLARGTLEARFLSALRGGTPSLRRWRRFMRQEVKDITVYTWHSRFSYSVVLCKLAQKSQSCCAFIFLCWTCIGLMSEIWSFFSFLPPFVFFASVVSFMLICLEGRDPLLSVLSHRERTEDWSMSPWKPRMENLSNIFGVLRFRVKYGCTWFLQPRRFRKHRVKTDFY